ncbi:hypothetical protein BC936DRAFT_147218 [Jimgerdemannia flammicorona]|uniref:Dol-P-Man:Man(5)GlcNAc(2)-PP-Dol alpha-1,3-mannosyltransferase n=1 Tax=Jimgerdemannia flammicorona TaxID=994334 RepID=A0A433D5W0_9FUNG|nr:hypothetical protein BC936DRAFT_147218 [Jimgerdemannia flammicorona]
MNILLFFPAFGVLLWKSIGAYRTTALLSLMIGIQLFVALPFLTTYPHAYFSRAFEFSRVFNYKWTVNWRLVDEETFLHPKYAMALATGHIVVLSAFLVFRWCRFEGGVLAVFLRGFTASAKQLQEEAAKSSPDHIITLLFTSNLIGMVFARSLHYQFYSWYFHALPHLVWHCTWGSPSSSPDASPQSVTPLAEAAKRTEGIWNFIIRLSILATIESCWLTFPSTRNSSMALLACHALILLGLWQGDAEGFADDGGKMVKMEKGGKQ